MTVALPNNKMNKRLLFALVVMTGGIHYAAQGLLWVITPSVEPTLLYKKDGHATRGEYVHFRFKHDLISDDEVSLTKRIACVEGDILARTGTGHFYCNGEHLGHARQYATNGTELPVFEWDSAAVPTGKAFVIGDHLESFDSRYWGFIEISDAQRLAVIF
ncbi:S26 family signal peptidase [Pseudoalteromonas luteoviolacea]|uniref:S26 family signal peptidase n=1 Tax=Pseudoalteromonas luteoviolacea TaxID=43657 RepID=UPI001B370361|nr:S26 family signal peptidase [Pseudoalteromonas luteoviolacea]MBQ4839847.1 S26 family signal peptidase [Pseudoalteromonas luteoviolacea]